MRSCLILTLISLAALAAPGALDRHPFSGATERGNRTFVVETNTFPELAESLADRLETSYPLFEDRFGPLEGRARQPMRVTLFRTRAEYLALGDGVEGAVGHFDPTFDRCALAWRGNTGAAGWPIAVHEACHHYVRRRFGGIALPSWYSEGIACYFEGLQDPTTERGVSRLRIAAARAAIESPTANLSLLLNAHAAVRAGRLETENYSSTRYYALAWSLVHFLATDPRYRPAFRRFELRLFAARPAAADAARVAHRILAEECGDLARLERRWRIHVRHLPVPARPARAPVYVFELRSPSAFVRYDALRRLGGRKLPRELRGAVVAAMTDRDLAVRTEACRMLARKPASDTLPGLVEALRRGDPQLKAIAIPALARARSRAAVPHLLAETALREEALAALAVIGDPRSFEALRRALLDRALPDALRARCAAALAADGNAIPELTVAADDSDRAVRTAARAALLRLGRVFHTDTGAAHTRRAADEARRINDFRAHARGADRALLGLSPQAEARTLRLLRRLVRDPLAPDGEKVRACALLGAARSEPAIADLRALCRPHHSDAVRLEAVRALVRITGETRGFSPGQPASERESVFRAWASS